MKYCNTCRSSYPPDFTSCPRDQTPLQPITDLFPGLVIRGKYEILGKLGSGGMGSVYKARHVAFSELRAVKFVNLHLSNDEAALARFHAEAVVARKLDHPNAVRVEDFDTTEDGRPFIVMEYVEGRSLRSILDQHGRLSAAQAIEIGRQACAALQAAHQIGVVHRDMKPDNIVLLARPGGADMVKILDFGLAKVRDGFDLGAGSVSTRTGRVLGTPQYMSPEQVLGRQGDELDGRSDLYSLGVVLYEMVTGRLPYDADTPMAMALQHVQAQPMPPQRSAPGARIPAPLAALILRALAKQPVARFDSALTMQAALAAVAEALPADSRIAVPLTEVESSRTERPTHVAQTTPAAQASTPTAAVTARPSGPVRGDTAGAVHPRRTPPPARLTQPGPKPSGSSWTLVAWLGVATLVVGGAVAMLRRNPGPAPAEVAPSATPVAVATPRAETDAPSVPTDSELSTEVGRLMRASAALGDAHLDVQVANGIVTLSGQVSSAPQAELATELARSVPGVRRVFNLAAVRPSAEPRTEPSAAESVAAAPTPAGPAAPPENPAERHKHDEVRRLLDQAWVQLNNNDPAAEQTLEAVLRLEPGNPVALHAIKRFRERRPPGPPPPPPR